MQLGQTGIGFVNAATIKQSSCAVFERENLALLLNVKEGLITASNNGEFAATLDFDFYESFPNRRGVDMETLNKLAFYLRFQGFHAEVKGKNKLEVFWTD